MNEMNILTLNGEQYEVADKVARESVAAANQEIAKKAEINDNVIDDTAAWSSNKIVETVCPPFEVAGPVVTCNPVVGYPLAVKSQIVPRQEGSGNPSPENVRPITPWNGAVLTQESDSVTKTFTATFPEPVYGGEVDWENEKVIISTSTKAKIKSTDIRNNFDSLNGDRIVAIPVPNSLKIPASSTSRLLICDILPSMSGNDLYNNATSGISLSQSDHQIRIKIAGIKSLPEVKAWIDSHTPSVVYPTETATVALATIFGTPAGETGVNTLYTDTGDTTVSGRSDPLAVIANQQAQIDELKKAIVSTGGNV